jgi:hypothetical protein
MSLVDLLRELATSGENTDLEQRAYGRAEEGTVLVVGSSGAPAFQNGWQSSGGVEFLRDRWARVRLGGLVVRSDQRPSTAVIFYLPIGYRPSEPVTLASNSSISTVPPSSPFTFFELAMIRVGADGAVSCTRWPTVGSQEVVDFLSLDGLDFPL